MKYCIYSGTFNPVHLAHLKLAKQVQKQFSFDKIIFIPAYIQPHKNKDYCIKSAAHRLNMLKLALRDYNDFELNDIEYQSDEPSYTFVTIKKLYERLPDIEGKINLIIGTDSLKNIYSWYKADELVKIVNFILLKRDEKEFEECNNLKNIKFSTLNAPKIEISSTKIREMVKLNMDIDDLVLPQVATYIKENNLYRE